MMLNNWIRNRSRYKGNKWTTFLKSTLNIVQRESFQFKTLFSLSRRFVPAHTHDDPLVCVCSLLLFLMKSHCHFILKAHTLKDFVGILSCARSLNSKLAKFNKMSTQNQLRSNRLDLIRSQLLLTSPLCLFTLDSIQHSNGLKKQKCERFTTSHFFHVLFISSIDGKWSCTKSCALFRFLLF